MPSPAGCCAANGAAACVAERIKKASRKTVGRRWRIWTLVNQARTGWAVLGDYSLRILKAGADCGRPQPSYEAGEGKSSGTLAIRKIKHRGAADMETRSNLYVCDASAFGFDN